MWKGFGTENEATESKSHLGYFRPRIASISGALHSLTKQRFLSPPSSAVKASESHFSNDNYGFDTTRINGSYLIGAMIAGGARASIGELIAYSRSASARASIDSTAAHAVYDLDFEGDKNSNLDEDGDDNKNSCSRRAKNCTRGLLLMIIITLCFIGTFHLVKLCYENGKSTFDYIANQTRLQFTFQKFNQSLDSKLSSSTSTSTTTTTSSTSSPPLVPVASFSRSKQFISQRRRNETVFDAPFFIAWFFSIWNIMFLPIFSIARLICFNREKISTKKMLIESIRSFMDRGYSLLQFFTRCGFFCFLLMFSNYLLIFSIRKLDTTVVMALFACSVSFFYLLSWVVLHQQFVGIRIVAVILCDTGIALLAYMNGVNRSTLSNVFLAVLSSISSAVYKVFYRRTFGYTSFAQMALFFSLIGLMIAFLMWPIILILYFAGFEILYWNYIPWLYISTAAILYLTANILSNFGLCWTYEVFLTLGLLFAIPATAAIDATLYHVKFEDMKLSGILLIMLGFAVVLLPDNWNHYLANIIRSWLAKLKTNESLKKNGSRVQDTTTAALSRLRTSSGRVK